MFIHLLLGYSRVRRGRIRQMGSFSVALRLNFCDAPSYL